MDDSFGKWSKAGVRNLDMADIPSDDKQFETTVQRLLKTPPKPHKPKPEPAKRPKEEKAPDK